MAKYVHMWMVDDTDGETDATETVTFALDGVSYQIDLSAGNASKLRNSLRPWQHHSRQIHKPTNNKTVERSEKPAKHTPRIDPSQTQAIREWAKANGYTVSPRGKIPAAVHDAFQTAHNS